MGCRWTSHFYTSALATAAFLTARARAAASTPSARPGCTTPCTSGGITMNDVNPDYVVVGETRNYNYEHLQGRQPDLQGRQAHRHQPDPDRPGGERHRPACRALVSPSRWPPARAPTLWASPNPWMMRTGVAPAGLRRGGRRHRRRPHGHGHHLGHRVGDRYHPGAPRACPAARPSTSSPIGPATSSRAWATSRPRRNNHSRRYIHARDCHCCRRDQVGIIYQVSGVPLPAAPISWTSTRPSCRTCSPW